MEKDLHKRLEEAADIYAKRIWNNLLEVHISKTDFLAGAELGYKEAITAAKGWLSDCIHNEEHISSHPYRDDKMVATFDFDNDKEGILSSFEREMNNLWEEK